MESVNAAAERDQQIAEYLAKVTVALNDVDVATPELPMFVETFGVSIGPWDTMFYTLDVEHEPPVYKRIDDTMTVITAAQSRALAALDTIDVHCWHDTGKHFTCTEADVLADLFKQLGKHRIAEVFLNDHAAGDDQPGDSHKACRYCGKLIESTDDMPPLSRQSSWRHADGTGAGVNEITRPMWCEGTVGYVKVEPEFADSSCD
jgi:hypothetical protein